MTKPSTPWHELLGSNHLIVPLQSPKSLQWSPWWFLLQLNDVSPLHFGKVTKDCDMFALLYLVNGFDSAPQEEHFESSFVQHSARLWLIIRVHPRCWSWVGTPFEQSLTNTALLNCIVSDVFWFWFFLKTKCEKLWKRTLHCNQPWII